MRLNKPTIVILLFLFIVGFSFLYYKEGILPVDKSDKTPKIFIVRPGEGLNSIAKNLKHEGLIRNTLVFYLIVKQGNIDKKIQAGDFRLSPSMESQQIAEELTHGTLDVWVTIVEGLRKEEIAQILSKELEIPEIQFNELAPEGYLFPDTYLFPRQATAGSVIKIMNDTFKNRYTSDMREKVKELGLSEHDAVTLASLVEREARSDKVRQEVAGILLKRLEGGIPLQVDATVQYALGYQPNEKTWWKRDLTFEDLKVNSEYNTYRIAGLPPDPISNPSLSALQAVANADPSTPYFFYITDSNGNMHYAKTSEEHNANIEKYLK